MFCPKCQAQNPEGSKCCIKCGAVFNAFTPDTQQVLNKPPIFDTGRKKKILFTATAITLLLLAVFFFIQNKGKFEPRVFGNPTIRETVNAYGDQPVAGEDFAKGEIIFGLKMGELTASSQSIQSATEIDKLDKTNPGTLLKIFVNYKANSLMRPFPDIDEMKNIYVLKVPEDTNILSLMTDLQKDKNIQFAEPDYYAKLTNYIPNDPYFSSSNSYGQGYDDLWNLKLIDMAKAWEITQGDPSVIVGVLDTGVDHLNPDLAGNVIEGWSGPIGSLKHGFTGDCYNLDGNDTNSELSHGTHVAGIISAKGDDNFGIIGVAPKVKIMPLTIAPCKKIPPDKLSKFQAPQMPGGESGKPNDALKFLLGLYGRFAGNIRALDVGSLAFRAADDNVKIINLSSQFEHGSFVMDLAVDILTKRRDMTFVTAAGNSGSLLNGIESPSNNPNAIVVSSVGSDDNLSDFSSFGPAVTVAAPGGGPEFFNIISTGSTQVDLNTFRLKNVQNPANVNLKVDDTHVRMMGTSQAAPHVAGLAALVKSLHPDWNNKKIRCAIIQGADDRGDPGWDESYGYGRINAYKTLLLQDVSEDCAPIAEISDPIMNSGIDISRPDVDISNPIIIQGTARAASPNYTVEYLTEGADPINSWELITRVFQSVINGDLATWDASNLEEGNYQLRLTVRDRDGRKASHEIAVYLYKSSRPSESAQVSESPRPSGSACSGQAGTECSLDVDCSSGLKCNEAERTKECNEIGICKPEKIIKRCSKNEEGNFCMTDSKCQSGLCIGFLCGNGGVGGKCDPRRKSPPSYGCQEGLVCGVTEVCAYQREKVQYKYVYPNSSSCQANDPLNSCREGTICASTGACSEGRKGYNCFEDSDCQQGLKCAISEEMKKNRFSYETGKCTEGEANEPCGNDTDCRSGLRCVIDPLISTHKSLWKLGICVKDCTQ